MYDCGTLKIIWQRKRQKNYFPEFFFSLDSFETAFRLYMAAATRENATRQKDRFR